MLSAGVDHGINIAIYLEYILLQYVDKLYGDANFPFQLDLAFAHSAT